jgi:oligoribonuclease NrnB/cAMP/cGMP phosphodiesterase (DHH superfamily)
MKTTVIHHSADFDGLFCREIARKFLPDAELIGWDYADAKIPFPSEGTVYVLDLSPDCFSDFMDAPDGHKRLIWIDHHKSAIEKYGVQHKFGAGYRIDGVAACRLAWQWFHIAAHNAQNQTNDALQVPLPDKYAFIDRRLSEPLAVRLAGEYDIWDKRDPRAELFQHGLRAQEMTKGYWDVLLDMDEESTDAVIDEMLDRGKALQYARTQENESVIKHNGFTVQFEGLTFLACNHARFNSHLFTAGIKPEHDALLGFRWDGKQWNVSLYHAPGKEHHDLSLIAVKLGGGGHKGACGFRATKLPFLP